MADNSKLAEVVARCHQELDELFLLHQEAVLLGNFDQAMQLLNCYKELHHLHMSFEDKELIPALDSLCDSVHWPASLYTAEHGKVEELLTKTEDSLSMLSRSQLSAKELRREVIIFLENEKTFKGVCEHHQEREEIGMLAELDEQTDADWRTGIIRPFLKEWMSCHERALIVVNGLEL